MTRAAAPTGILHGKTDLKVGYTCNNRCVHCVISDQRERAVALRGREDLKTSELVAALTQARRAGSTDVVFTGGEPTLRRDLFRLLSAARLLGLRLHLQTNGRRFADPTYARRMAPFQVQYVVALHGPDAATHDAITRAPGSFEQTLAGVRALLGLGQRVLAKVVLSRLNLTRLPELVGLLADLGVPLVNLAFPHALGEARVRFHEVVPRLSEVVPFLRQAVERHAGRIDLGIEAVPFCLLPGMEERVTDVPLRDCACVIEHRQLDQEPRDWREARHEMKRKPASCASCRWFDRCEGVWGEYLDAFGGDELVPVPATERDAGS
jgi:MoaA/NifB/PqqE/SkfB family radical SAM enzyme